MNARPLAGRRGPRTGLLLLSGLLLILADTGYAVAAICRVTTEGTAANSGASWASSMALQTALDDVNCTEIWMAGGFYRHQPGSPQTLTWTISRELALYGGFAGTETSRDERDFVANVTVLSGDIDLNDINEDGNHIAETTDDIVGNNSYRILFIDGTTGISITPSTILDGLTITAANGSGGNGLFCDGSGSSVFNMCSPTLRNLTFIGNYGGSGGAIYNNGSSGGESNPVLINVMFSHNDVGNRGGAMYNYGGYEGNSSPTLIHVTFNGNFAASGGAMYNFGGKGSASPHLIDVAFKGNSAGSGGAMNNNAQRYDGGDQPGVSSPTLYNVTFKDNHAYGAGGAIYNVGGGPNEISSPTLVNVTFSGNTAGYLDGTSSAEGGAMFNLGSGGGRSSPTLINVTLTGNIADTGGALYNYGYYGGISSPTLSNVIMWGNTAITGNGPGMYNDAQGTSTAIPTIDHSIVQGSGGSDAWDPLLGIDGGGNLDSDPALGPLGYHGGFTETHVPAAGSVAIDAGNASTCPDVDQRYVPRPQGPVCDVGAVEFGVDYLFANGFELATPTP